MKTWQAFKAFDEGEKVEFRYVGLSSEWLNMKTTMSFSIREVENGMTEFRIKPKPQVIETVWDRTCPISYSCPTTTLDALEGKKWNAIFTEIIE